MQVDDASFWHDFALILHNAKSFCLIDMPNSNIIPDCYLNASLLEPKSIPFTECYSPVFGEEIAFWHGTPRPHAFAEHRHCIHQLTILPGEDAECEISWITGKNERKTRQLKGPQVFYVAKHVPHAISLHSESPIIHLYLSDIFIKKYAPAFLWNGITIKKWWDAVRSDLHVWFTTSFIISSCAPLKNHAFGNLEIAAMFLASNLLMLDEVYCRRSTARSLSALQLRKVIDFIHENFRKPLTVQQIAEAAGIGKDHFAHLFKATTGRTPHYYLLAVKINHAQQLLRKNGSMTLAEVAVESGFFDQSHFGRSLRRFCMDHEKLLQGYTNYSSPVQAKA